MPRTSSRSRGRQASKGRAEPKSPKSAKKATPKKAAAAAPAVEAPKMEFEEGAAVMAKWPGTQLYFKSKVTYVREEDNEYDVQFEDGTVYTLKAKDVKKSVEARKAAPKPRSRSRGRSPGRKPKDPAAVKSPAAPKPKATQAPKPDATPTRQSARIAARADAISDDDETHGKKAIPNPSHTAKKSGGLMGFLKSLSFEWVGALFMMALFPFILVSLHTLCTASSCKPALPLDKLPKTLKGYWDQQAFLIVLGFAAVLRVLSFIPLGARMKTSTGMEVRMNGFITLLALLAVMPALVYKKVDLSVVQAKYFYLMTSSLILAACVTLFTRIVSHFKPGKKSNINPKGNTGNPIVDLFNGREFNPAFLGADFKLQTFRISMIGLAMINVTMVVENVMKNGGQVNPLVVMASAFQVLYSLDAMFFEEYFFFSHDAMNTGYGFSLVSNYFSFPFLPTMVTKYLIVRNPTLPWYNLVAIAVMNGLGYIIFRASETQRCEFAKDPNSAAMKRKFLKCSKSDLMMYHFLRYFKFYEKFVKPK